MQSLKCEMCGSHDIIKKEGVYICEHCGTKYSPEEAKKIFIESTIKIDNSASVKNFLVLAENACESKNYVDAENYSNKVLEINTNEPNAWFIKGKAAGWQTTLRNLRLEEAANCFNKALDLKEDETFKIDVQKELKEILSASVNLALEIYSDDPSFDYSFEVLNVAKLSRSLYVDICGKYSLDKGDFEEVLMIRLVTAIVNIYSSRILKDYKGVNGHPSDSDFVEYLDRADGAVGILDYAATLGNNNIGLTSAYKKKIEILTDKESSKSYEIGSDGNWEAGKVLTDEAKKLIIDEIMETHKKWNSIDPSHKIPKRPSPSGGCYIATAVYGSYDCPQVWVLRRYRDLFLLQKWYGKLFVKFYYVTSPTLVHFFGESKWFKILCLYPLNRMVKWLKNKGVSDKPYYDN